MGWKLILKSSKSLSLILLFRIRINKHISGTRLSTSLPKTLFKCTIDTSKRFHWETQHNFLLMPESRCHWTLWYKGRLILIGDPRPFSEVNLFGWMLTEPYGGFSSDLLLTQCEQKSLQPSLSIVPAPRFVLLPKTLHRRRNQCPRELF